MAEYSRYPVEVISGIAEETGMGMVCFLNPGTLETESVPGASYGSYGCGGFDEYYQEVYRKVERWENCVRIDPPEPGESFGIMERFIWDGNRSETSNMSLMEADTARNGLTSDGHNLNGL